LLFLHHAWVKEGVGKLTEADLLARLGPPDEMETPTGAETAGER
jgi:hypothetical protein